MGKNIDKEDYNWKWHNFIVGIMNGKDRYLAYCEAYGIDPKDKNKYNAACADSSRLVRNAKFQLFWNDYLESIGFNNAQVDAQLLKHIKSNDESVSLKAIGEYNKLRGRITNKNDVVSNGETINPIYGLTADELRKLAGK